MDFSDTAPKSGQKFGGLAVVIFLHVLLIYALVSGLARKAAHVVVPELVAEIIEPVKPPPPPPPPVIKTPPPPRPQKVTAPPPPFVPRPEVKVATPPPPTPVTTVTNTAPPTPELPRPAPPAPPAPAAPPAPIAAPPVRVAGINDLNSCKPDYPRASLVAEETGVTRVEFIVGSGGELVDAKVKRSSGSRNLDRAAVAGLSRCKFNPGTQDGKPVQSTFSVDYVWKLDN